MSEREKSRFIQKLGYKFLKLLNIVKSKLYLSFIYLSNDINKSLCISSCFREAYEKVSLTLALKLSLLSHYKI